MATKLISADQEMDLELAITDNYQNKANVDGSPTWVSGDEAIVSLTIADDGFSAVARAVGPVGTAQISVRADADIGEGMTEIVAVLDVEVIGGTARMVALNASEPRMKAEDPVVPTPDEPTEPTPEEPAPVDPELPVEPTPDEPAPEVPTEPETPVEPTPDVPVEPVPEEPAPVDPTEPAPPVDGGDVPVEPPPVEEVPGDTDTPRSRRRR